MTELHAEVIQKYVDRMGEKISRIKALLASSNWDDLRIECHRLKGSGASYGFAEVSELGAKAEKDIKESAASAAGSVSELVSLLEKIWNERKSR